VRQTVLSKARVKLIVGLGNPGLSYRATRHNAGARALEYFAKKNKFIFKADRSLKSLVAEKTFRGHAVCLVLPQTFMNLSGEAVFVLVRKKRIAASDILVACDDAAIALGKIKIKARGSDGGHNGLASIIERLGTRDIPRLRIGIGHPGRAASLSDYVLSSFGKEEEAALQKVLEKAASVLGAWVLEGIDYCMNHFNQTRT
jgi:PTH1 family peptidyl-tRNA hydrolase